MVSSFRVRAVAPLLLMLTALVGCAADAPSPSVPAEEQPSAGAQIDPIGSYEARISNRDFRSLGYLKDIDYGGRWNLHLDFDAGRHEIEYLRLGTIGQGELALNGDSIVFDEMPAPTGTFNCYKKGGRVVGQGQGRASYRFDLSGADLVLEPIRDPCPFRRLILTRTWTR